MGEMKTGQLLEAHGGGRGRNKKSEEKREGVWTHSVDPVKKDKKNKKYRKSTHAQKRVARPPGRRGSKKNSASGGKEKKDQLVCGKS